MKKSQSQDQRRVFARTKARALPVEQLKGVNGGMPLETHFFCGGDECDGCDSW